MSWNDRPNELSTDSHAETENKTSLERTPGMDDAKNRERQNGTRIKHRKYNSKKSRKTQRTK